MKNVIFWDVTLCGSCYNCSLILSTQMEEVLCSTEISPPWKPQILHALHGVQNYCVLAHKVSENKNTISTLQFLQLELHNSILAFHKVH
jgi:hypothetical protein